MRAGAEERLKCLSQRREPPVFQGAPVIDLVSATTIVDKALAHGRGMGLPPLTVAVLDAAGCLVSFKREDGSSLLRPEIAQAKAWGTLGMGIGGRAIAQRAAVAPAFIAAVNNLAAGRIVPVPGGVLIRGANNAIIGAVGITGAISEQDEACAVAGIEAAGFTADTGEAAPSRSGTAQ
jgi:uncharacterized protein GlcG (DUF336 family)